MAREMNVIPYDPNWALLYQKEKAVLVKVLGDILIDIHHFGSTSIVGMTAKPTIDVMVVVNQIEMVDEYDEDMAASGYIVRGEQGIPRRRYFVQLKEDGENHAAHIHVHEKGNPHITDGLMFRDYVSIDKKAFLKYESMKKEVAEKHRFSPGEYQDAKYSCVMEIMEEARRYYR